MKNRLLNAGMMASLVMALAAPALIPNVVLAQADIRQEDRRADRQLNRQEDRREVRQLDRRADRREDHSWIGEKIVKMTGRWTAMQIDKRATGAIAAATAAKRIGLEMS